MGLDLELVDGQTPLDEEEKEGLLIPTITTRGELDEFEQFNIEKAIQWTLTRNYKKDKILTENIVKTVNKKLAWTGTRLPSNYASYLMTVSIGLTKTPLHLMKLPFDLNTALCRFTAFLTATGATHG